MRDESDDIDRGWFSPERDKDPTGAPTSLSGAPLSAERLEQVRATLDTYDREVAASIDPRRRAVLCYEIGRIYEQELVDHRRAVRFYQRAFQYDPTHLPTLQAGQRIFARARRWPMVLKLAEVEARIHPSQARRVELLRSQGDIYLTRYHQPADAATCYRRALDLSPDDPDLARSLAHAAQLAGDRSLARQSLARAARHEHEPGMARSLALEAAQAHLAEGESDAAASLLESRLQGESDPETLALLGRIYRTAGRFAAYVEVTARLAATRPPQARARLLTDLARSCADEHDDLIGALGLLDQAIAADPDARTAVGLLVELRSRSGEWGAAAEALERFIALTPDAPTRVDARWQLAVIHLDRLADEAAAARVLRALLAEAPGWAPAVAALGRILADQGDWLGLVRLHEDELEALADDRAKAAKAFKIGEIHELQRDDPRAAEAAYRRAVHADPGFLLAGKALGRMLVRLGDWVGYVALLEAEAARADDPTDQIYAWRQIAEVCALNLDDPERAIQAWHQVLKRAPDHLDAIRSLARLCARTGRHQELLDINEQELALLGSDTGRLTLLVRSAEIAERALGDLNRARAYLEQALSFDAHFLPALQAMGRIAGRTRRWAELCELYEAEARLTETPRERVGLYIKRGEILRDRLNDLDGAVKAFEAALELVPDQLSTLRALQRLHALKGDTAREAQVVAAEVELVEDGHSRALLLDRLGRLYVLLERPDLAAGAWGRAIREVPDFREALQGLLDAQAEAGDHQALIETHRRLALSAGSQEEAVTSWLAIARVAERDLDQPVEAIEALETVLKLMPGHLGALLGLERLYLARGQVTELVVVYDNLLEAVAAVESRVDILSRRARLLAEHQNDQERARRDYLAILELVPDHREALVWVEGQAADTGDVEQLARVLQRRLAISDAPHERQMVLSRAADVLRRSGRLEEAAHCYESVLQMDPDAVVAIRALREVYEALGDDEKALHLAEAEGRRSLDPRTAAALLVEAGITRESAERDSEGALADYLEALARNPDDSAASAAVRRICERTNRWEVLAEALEERALASTKERTERLLEVARLRLARMQQPEAAVAVLDRSGAREDASPETLRRLADLYTELGAWRQAADVYVSLCARSDDATLRRAVVYRLAAIYQEKLGDPTRAGECLRLILTEHPGEVEARARLARVAIEAGEPDQARVLLREAITLTRDPLREAPLRGRLARLEVENGQLMVAMELLEPAVAAVPDDFELAELLAVVCVRLGLHERLRGVLRRAIDAVAELPTSANRLRRLMAEQTLAAGGTIGEALSDLEEAIAAAPDDVGLRQTHAHLASRSVEHLGAALQSRRWLALRSPLDVENLRELRRLSTRAERFDQAYELARLLNGLEQSTEADGEAIQRWHGGVRRWPTRPLEELDRRAVRAPTEPPGLAEVLATLTTHLPDVFSTGASRNRPAPDGIRDVAERVAEAFGMPLPDLRIDGRGLDQSLAALDGTLVLGEALEQLSIGEQAFVIGTHLELTRRGLTALTRWAPTSLRGVLEALAAVGGHRVQGVAFSTDQINARASSLAPRIAQIKDPALGQALERLRKILPGLDMASARAALMVGAHRLALLTCGGVLPALNALRRMAGDVPPARVPGLADLIRWVVAEPYFAQRRSLGLAPAP
jgi:tetratricopeptide (TPR) repeat protein